MRVSDSFAVTDITSGKYKVIAVCMFEQFWSIGLLMLPGIASYWDSWSLIYMAISTPFTIFLIFLYPLIPNSPRWLIKKGRIREAKEVLLNAARINGKTDFTEANLEKQLQIQAAAVLEVPPEPSYWEMWRGQAKNLTAVHLSWAITIVTYYGFLLNIRNFGVQYLEENTIICGETEFFSPTPACP
jgi:Sugar (and other) transporter